MEKIKEVFIQYKYYIMGVLVFITILILGLVLFLNRDSFIKRKVVKEVNIKELVDSRVEGITDVETTDNIDIEEESRCSVSVDIKGYINKPGVYNVDCGFRIQDIVNMAGGLRWNADTSVINLSKKVFDEMVIIIYSKDEVSRFVEVKKVEEVKNSTCSSNLGQLNDGCIDNSSTDDKKDDGSTVSTKVSINKGTKDQLMTLSGIGESKADDIINYRNTNGSFEKIEDLMNVKGIGEAVFAKIKENIIL